MYDFGSIKLLYFILIFCSINKVKILYCHAINYNLCFINLCFILCSVYMLLLNSKKIASNLIEI